MYLGMGEIYPRATGLITLFFMQVEWCRKNTNLFATPFGQFMVSGVASTTAWAMVWPFEVLKNLTQAETKNVGSTTMERAKFIMKTHGV